MGARIIDGHEVAKRILGDVARDAASLKAEGCPVRLCAIIVGTPPGGELYAQKQQDTCVQLGIQYRLMKLAADSTQEQVAHVIAGLNRDPDITGVMLHMPLPKHLDAAKLQYLVDPIKDVEGIHPANMGYSVYGRALIGPCTAMAAVELVLASGIDLAGKETVMVGASEIAGKPIALLLSQRMATVTICHIATRDLKAHTRRAEVLVVAVGKAGLITREHVMPGAVVVDVGINRIKDADGKSRVVGDVDFDGVKGVAGAITPVPGGVGPVTVAMLMRNTLRGAQLCRDAR